MTTADILILISASLLLLGITAGIMSAVMCYSKYRYTTKKYKRIKKILTLSSGLLIIGMFGTFSVALGIENYKNQTSEIYWSVLFFILFSSITAVLTYLGYKTVKK